MEAEFADLVQNSVDFGSKLVVGGEVYLEIVVGRPAHSALFARKPELWHFYIAQIFDVARYEKGSQNARRDAAQVRGKADAAARVRGELEKYKAEKETAEV